jgi:hypothetical protein
MLRSEKLGTFSGDVLVAEFGPEHPGHTRGVSSIAPWIHDTTGSWRTSVQLKKLRKSSMKERCKKKLNMKYWNR